MKRGIFFYGRGAAERTVIPISRFHKGVSFDKSIIILLLKSQGVTFGEGHNKPKSGGGGVIEGKKIYNVGL